MALSDAQPCPLTRYVFRVGAWEDDSPHAGPLRFLCSRSGRAVPLYPGGPDRCRCLCLHDPHGLRWIRPVGHPHLSRFEAYMDSLTLRLTPSWHRGFDIVIARRRRSGHYMCH